MTLLQAVFLVLGSALQETSQLYPLEPAVPGGSIVLPTEYVPFRSTIPEVLEFGKRLGEEDWELLRVRIVVHNPMLTSTFSSKELAEIARLGGDVESIPIPMTWKGAKIPAWEVRYAEGEEEPSGMFGIIAYVQQPTRWVQVLVAAPSNYEDVVRAEADGVLSGLNLQGGFGSQAPVGLLIVFYLLIGVGAILSLIGMIWTLVGMFQGGDTTWGVVALVLCLCSLTSLVTLIYSIRHRDRLGGAMWLHIVGILLSVVGYVILLVGIGMMAP